MCNVSIFVLAALSSFSLYLSSVVPGRQAENCGGTFTPNIPRMWDDAAIATLEVPLANPIGTPKRVSADYYYKIPVRPIYRFYPLYAPGREPPGYMDWLQHQEPVIEWATSVIALRSKRKLTGSSRARWCSNLPSSIRLRFLRK